ncbi:hypothetical protein [Priestia abyssalis]|uniref:hypothetical protein n=1 Tax=Priestia abyssalis TaxID=1221450 RepID=UPI00099527BA|nr:hypothetical protein [Priestia abyssalis]
MSNIRNQSQLINDIPDIETFKQQLKLKVHQYGDFKFEDDEWYYNKMHKTSELPNVYTISFSDIVPEYKNEVKYYVLMKEDNVKTLKRKVSLIGVFLHFFKAQFPDLKLVNINRKIIDYYENSLRESDKSENVKSRSYTALQDFFLMMSDFPEFPTIVPIKSKSPFRVTSEKNPEKYIPTEVVKQFDKIMFDENNGIPSVFRLTYWLQRSFPNRISEVTSLPIGCLKSLYDMYVINVPTTKQNGGYLIEEIKTIPVLNSGHGKYIVDLIKKVKKQTKELLNVVPVDKINKNFLLLSSTFELHIKEGRLLSYNHFESYSKLSELRETFPKATYTELAEKMAQAGYFRAGSQQNISRKLRDGLTDKHNKLLPFDSARFNNIMNRIAVLCNITYEGNIYKITSHQFRHNASTDRLYVGGYTVDQLMVLRNDKGTTMPMQYIHQQKEMHKKMWVESTGLTSPNEAPVEFKGRIINLDDKKIMDTLSRDPRMYLTWETNSKKGVGLCSMISGCNPKGTAIHFECYECDWFVPKAEYYEDYQKELVYWENLMKSTAGQPKRAATYENSIRNVNCLERIVKICENGIEKYKKEIEQKLEQESWSS